MGEQFSRKLRNDSPELRDIVYPSSANGTAISSLFVLHLRLVELFGSAMVSVSCCSFWKFCLHLQIVELLFIFRRFIFSVTSPSLSWCGASFEFRFQKVNDSSPGGVGAILVNL